uniref:SH3 domain-containing protein n=1 Tax=Caldilinea aerophila TaxID=133453 RepID=A0A7C1JX98_9CHLR
MRRFLIAIGAVFAICIILIGGVFTISGFSSEPGIDIPQSTASSFAPTNIVSDEHSFPHDLDVSEMSESINMKADSDTLLYQKSFQFAGNVSNIAQPTESASLMVSEAAAAPFVVVIRDVFLYTGPGLDYEQTGSLKAGNAVRVRACNPGCTWYQLDSGTWIPGEGLSAPPLDLPIFDIEAIPTASAPVVFVWPTVTPTPLPTPTPEWSGPRAKEYAILRRGPGTIYDRVGVAVPGAPLRVTAQNQAGDWYQLENGAWVAAFLLDRKPGELPIAANIPPRPAGARDLAVTFSSPWYACHQSSTLFATPFGEEILQWVYRSFRVTMTIRNLNTAPLLPIYKPTRWILTDGSSEFVETVSWVEPGLRYPAERQRILYYDDSSLPETWYLLTLRRDQWVRAVEFEWNGEVYRTEFSLEEARAHQNYKDCGAPRDAEN